MRLISFRPSTHPVLKKVKPEQIPFYMGAVVGEKVLEFTISIPSLDAYIRQGALIDVDVRRVVAQAEAGQFDGLTYRLKPVRVHHLSQVLLEAPIHPNTLRDFYAFEQHVKTANENRGREVPAAWYDMPVFYFSNHTAIYGPGAVIPHPKASQALDYELEVACIIGKPGKDIPAEKAEDYIFGYTIFNDWSARDLQRQEVTVGLGPAKAKDFASSLGPAIVTKEALADKHTGRPGVYDLAMVARVNGEERSRGNWKDIHYSFGELVARASQDVQLFPGDVIGSGTVGTGCLLELTKGQGPWLQPGDVVELEIERFGVLQNTIG